MAWMQIPEALTKLPRLLFRGRFSFTCEGVLHVAERLSFRRRMNLIKSGIDLMFQLDQVYALPPIVIIESTNICNLRCPLCPSGEGSMERKRGLMSFETFQKILDELGDVLIFAYLHCWGEPFINKEMPRMIEACKDRNIQTMLSTNGQFLQTLDEALKVVDAGLTTMIIALDGSTQEIYQVFRKGGDVEKVKRCAALIEEAKALRGSKLPYTNLRVVVTRHTQDDLHNVEKLAHDIGVNMFSYKDVDPQALPERVEDYRPTFGSVFPFGDNSSSRRRRMLIPCIYPLRQPTIFWDGTVVGCEYDYDLEKPLGKVGEQSFAKIWNSPQASDLRRGLREEGLGGRSCPRLCPYQFQSPNGTLFKVKELRPLYNSSGPTSEVNKYL